MRSSPTSSTGATILAPRGRSWTSGLSLSERRQTKLPPDLAGLVTVAVRHDEALVVAGCTSDLFENCDESRVIVLDGATLGVIDELDLAAGASLGGYDLTGRYLIYTDAERVARWHSADGTGVLGEGFTWATWSPG